MQALAVEAVERMREKMGVKRARTTVEPEQQVLAQLAAMNMKVDQIYNRMDAMEAANTQGREEARAYYDWMRGHYPPPGVSQFPPFDPSFMR
nr:hypothetical protein Itr_chr08CG11110 [Ipomoea trifida]